MSKLLLVILIALSTGLFTAAAKADNVVAQCAVGKDKEIATDLIKDDRWIPAFTQGYADLNSRRRQGIIGGEDTACRPGERPYVCDATASIYCTVGAPLAYTDCVSAPRLEIAKKSGDKAKIKLAEQCEKDKKSLTFCEYAGDDDWQKVPLKAEVIPDQWNAKDSRGERWNPDTAKCGFAQGALRVPCKYAYIFHGITSRDQIRDRQDKIIKKEDDGSAGFSCRSKHEETVKSGLFNRSKEILRGEDTRSIIADMKNEGEKWKNRNQWPNAWGAPLVTAPPVAVTPQTPLPPPRPADTCNDDQWNVNSDCGKWNNCKQHVPGPEMKLCSCAFDQCRDDLEGIGNRFSELSPDSGNGFLRDNRINERAQNALRAIAKFRSEMNGVSLSGTYYQNGDLDHCVFARVTVLGDLRNSPGSCKVDSTTPNLRDLENNLQTLSSTQDISSWELNKMADSFHTLGDLSVNFDPAVAKVTTTGFLENVQHGPKGTPLYDAANDLLFRLSELAATYSTVPFYEMLKNKNNARYFKNRMDKRPGPLTGLALREEVGRYYSSTNHNVQCITPPVSTDSASMDLFKSQFKDDFQWEQLLTALDVRCNGGETPLSPAAHDKCNDPSNKNDPRCRNRQAPVMPYRPAVAQPVTPSGPQKIDVNSVQ